MAADQHAHEVRWASRITAAQRTADHRLLGPLRVAELRAGIHDRALGRLSDSSRNDLQVRAGLPFTVQRLSLHAVALARGSVTDAEYVSAVPSSNAKLRWGLGGAAGVELALANWIAVYTDIAVDVATSWSDYRVNGVPLKGDPPLLLCGSLGLVVQGRL